MFLACIELLPDSPDAEGVGLWPLEETAVPADNMLCAILCGPVKFCVDCDTISKSLILIICVDEEEAS